MSDSIISPELIFITGSFARDREYRKGADIDLIYLTKNSGRVYSESFVVGNVRFQMTFMPFFDYANPGIRVIDQSIRK